MVFDEAGNDDDDRGDDDDVDGEDITKTTTMAMNGENRQIIGAEKCWFSTPDSFTP